MTDPRQELQTLAASALMVGLHQAIEAYHEAVRGAKAGEHSRVSANAPVQPTLAANSERVVAISFGLFRILLHDRDARRRQRRCQATSPTSPRRLIGAASDANEITARQRHLGDGGHNGRAIQRVPAGAFIAACVLHTGVPRPDSGQQRRHRSRRFKIAHAPARPNPPAACPCVVRPCMSACGAAYRQTSARMRSTAGSDVATYDPPVARCDSLRRRSTRGG
jgi:hypothetical protein